MGAVYDFSTILVRHQANSSKSKYTFSDLLLISLFKLLLYGKSKLKDVSSVKSCQKLLAWLLNSSVKILFSFNSF